MKLKQLFEARDSYGIVVSHDRKTGAFEDIGLVDWATDDILDAKPSHARNMLQMMIEIARDHNMWGSIESILKRNSRQQVELGPDFDDIENFVITKYGPYNADEIGHLAHKLED